jgi:predicted methyltransferase
MSGDQKHGTQFLKIPRFQNHFWKLQKTHNGISDIAINGQTVLQCYQKNPTNLVKKRPVFISNKR